jgi:hypothetical protein
MGIDTDVPGSPASVEGAAHWVADTLRPGLDTAGTVLTRARTGAAGDWQGAGGDSFVRWSGNAVGKVDQVADGAGTVSAALLAFAGRLRSAQHRMAAVREEAAGAGLTVSGRVVEDPGPGPARPGPLPDTGMPSPAAAEAHAAAVTAYDAHQDRIRAYHRAAAETAEVQADLRAASDQLADTYRGLQGLNWFTNGGDLLGGLAGAVVEFQASVLRGTSDELLLTARHYLDSVRRADPALVGHSRWYAHVDLAEDEIRHLEDLGRHADDLDRGATRLPLKLGGALTVVGIGYDIATGKDPVEATVSGAGGFAASVATGALVGTAIGGPVGTAVGAVVGAGVGIFASGAIDSLFENGPDVGKAFESGADAVADTGEAIGDAVGGAVGGAADAIGGLFD